TETIHDRERTFRSWQAYSTNDLLGILEHGEFPPPMDPFYGAQHIIEQLYYSPRRALSSEQLGRLDAMAASSCASLEPAVALRLECWLAVLHRDRDRLERFWSRWIGTVKLAASDAFATAAGDLQLDSGPVIDSFMEVVRSSGMFGPRFDAMVALGKIGSSAGETAAATIAAHIYQSSQQVAAVRDLSIERNTPHTTHLQDPSASAKIIRERHPFEGRTLSVLSSSRRRGVWHLLVILPDGSRSLVPAAWTDWRGPTDTTRGGSKDATIFLHHLRTLSDFLQ